MSACTVDSSIAENQITSNDLNESGLKRMAVEDVAKLLKDREAVDSAGQQGGGSEATAPQNGEASPPPAPEAKQPPTSTDTPAEEAAPKLGEVRVKKEIIEEGEEEEEEVVEPPAKVIKTEPTTDDLEAQPPSSPSQSSPPPPPVPQPSTVTVSKSPIPKSPAATERSGDETVGSTSRKRTVVPEKEVGGGGETEGSSGSESDTCRKRSRLSQSTVSSGAPPLALSNGNQLTGGGEDERERAISDFVSEVSQTADSISDAAEKLAKEVEGLAELAVQKELEWNTILRVKKLKEEMLERVLRRKRMNHFDSQLGSETLVPDILHNKTMPEMPVVRHPRLAEIGKLPQRPILPKPCYPSPHLGLSREGRNGPILDVKSIIDDYSTGYRSRHPEGPAARRGRRLRQGGQHHGPAPAPVPAPEQRYSAVNSSLISMANMALGTGASVRTVSDHINYMGMGSVDGSGRAVDTKDGSGQRGGGGGSANGGGGKPYPEVTLHPVSPPSLLHQVLTKSTPPRPTNFSPTLARLLTAPERPPPPPPFRPPPSRASIAEILSSSKLSNSKISQFTLNHFPSVLMALVNGQEDGDEKEAEAMIPDKPRLERTVAKVKTANSKKATAGKGEKQAGVVTSSPASAPKKKKKKKPAAVVKKDEPEEVAKTKKISQAVATESPLPSPPSHSNSSNSKDSIDDPPSKKSRNEITITPVSGNHPGHGKKEDVVCLDDDDNESGDRLVIDEGGEDVPACQGCRSKSAQFVCAGCGNQWYCSRECQVSAWEEHSDLCSG